MPTQPPPDLPASSQISPLLSDYLRRLSTWAFQEINKKVTKDEATPHVIFAASDQKQPTSTFKLTVDSTGTVGVSQVPLGKGKP